MSSFNVFENDHQVLSIGGLSIENHTDEIVIYGDVQIDKTQAGLEQAQALLRFAQDLVTAIQACQEKVVCQEKVANTQTDETGDLDEIDNPFA